MLVVSVLHQTARWFKHWNGRVTLPLFIDACAVWPHHLAPGSTNAYSVWSGMM